MGTPDKLQKTPTSPTHEPAAAVGDVTKRHFPIAYKLALVFTVLITAGMTLLGLIVARDQTKLIDRQTNEFGSAIASQMAESAKESLLASDTLALQLVLNNLITHERIIGAALYADDFQPVAQAGVVPPGSLLRELVAEGGSIEWENATLSETTPTTVMSFVTPIMLRDVRVGFALITFDLALLKQARIQTLQAVAGATVLLVLLGIAVSIVLAERVTRPIYQLMNVSRAMSQGNFEHRLNVKRNDEIGALTRSLNRMADGLVRKEQVEKAFSRYVSPKVAEKIMNDLEEVRMGGQHVQATVLFADIVGFTSLSEDMTPTDISTLLNEYFAHINRAADVYQGYIDKFIGDCVMVVFGVPEEDPKHCFHAVACAILMRSVVDVLNHLRARRGQATVQFKIGINSGSMVAGNMGSADRMEYTVVGDAVNLASRLSAAAGPGEIIVSKELYDCLEQKNDIIAEPHDTMFIRGKKAPVASYRIIDMTEAFSVINDQYLHQIFKATRVKAV